MATTIEELVDQISAGAPVALTPFEYYLLKDHIAALSKVLKEFETGRDNLKKVTPPGQTFTFRGQPFTVRKLRTQTDWHGAYDLAFSLLTEEVQQSVSATVQEEYIKDVFSAEPVYNAQSA